MELNVGIIELNVRIREFMKPWMFHVLTDLEYPCILGVDFINGSKIVLDFDRKALVIPDSQIEKVVTTIEERNMEIDIAKIGSKLITPFQKLLMVLDGTEFAVGDIEKWFDEARRNTKAKHEKWAKYCNRRRRDVQIKVNVWVLVRTHPFISSAQKVVAKFKPNFECPYRLLEVKHNNLVVWRVGKRLAVNADRVRLYHHRKSDEKEFSKSCRRDETVMPNTSGYSLRPRRRAKKESQPSSKKRTQQVRPVGSGGNREQQYSAYAEELRRSGGRCTRSSRVSNSIARRGLEKRRVEDPSPLKYQ
ncbi:uncharacterized protein TNCV_368541 [Trichonephila clavipes]|nr:uncharacterized protein TNCV_368541 [Trichonephila clavipes]